MLPLEATFSMPGMVISVYLETLELPMSVVLDAFKDS
jgi:hypothetical protein